MSVTNFGDGRWAGHGTIDSMDFDASGEIVGFTVAWTDESDGHKRFDTSGLGNRALERLYGAFNNEQVIDLVWWEGGPAKLTQRISFFRLNPPSDANHRERRRLDAGSIEKILERDNEARVFVGRERAP